MKILIKTHFKEQLINKAQMLRGYIYSIKKGTKYIET